MNSKNNIIKNYFSLAYPIWETDKEKEINLRLQFKSVVEKLENSLIRIATSGMYQLWINGNFVCYGPARAGKNHFRVDEIDISSHLTNVKNVVVIEVAGYNTNSYAIQNQPSFLQTEILDGSSIVAFTGRNFTARKNPYYYQKTPRYSFQRAMMESYHFDNPNDDFFTNCNTVGNLSLATVNMKKFVSRVVDYPEYTRLTAEQVGVGNFDFSNKKEPWRDRPITDIGSKLIGFKMNELDVFPSEEITNINYSQINRYIKTKFLKMEYSVYKLPFLTTGFLTFKINCSRDTRIYILFDEILDKNGIVNHIRSECANILRLDLCEGKHSIQLFEVYAMQYVQFLVYSGKCEIISVGMTEYKHKPIDIPKMNSEKLQIIANAAAESFCQNALDIYMDCPSRERAGWLCDSFFSGRTEKYVTDECSVEKSFLENYLHEENYDYLPDGMLPMCYPADHYDGMFIPQWAMWLVLELGEYYERSNDEELVERFRPKLRRLSTYFEQFENSDGLLENLDGWQFVEWSKANELVDGVNYPTNMLYSAMLKTMGELYSDSNYTFKSINVKNEVLKQSFNGEFFIDNAVRKNGELIPTGEITEVCQYYAFFLQIATKDSHANLFNTLISDFGPERKDVEKWKKIYSAVPFIGYFLRLEIMSKYGYYEKLADNIEKYYYDMAVATGTLWEHADLRASCCHGFSGYILCWLGLLSNNGY